MDKEIKYLLKLLKITYEGQPWFGRSAKALLSEIDATVAAKKMNGQHSILELLYHMINWREFTISRLQAGNDKPMQFFEDHDWRQLDHSDPTLWDKGIQLLENSQQLLTTLLGTIDDSILGKPVADREYNYRFLLHGIIQHDIYHLGQIAYVKKLFS